MFSRQTLRIATRASELALWQSRYIADLIRQADPSLSVELVHVTTTGDRVQNEALRTLGQFGVFTREVQLAVLDGRADLAVHSLKDLPTEGPAELILAATPVRADTSDALVMPVGNSAVTGVSHLKIAARIGTGSPRRQAQLLRLRPDFELSEIRGNVESRIRKLDEGQFDAIILATAGLTRLGLANRIHSRIVPPEMYPAVGQAAIGVECRTEDNDLRELLSQITDQPTLIAVTAERSLLAALRAGCHAPLGVQSTIESNTIRLEGVVLSLDGKNQWIASGTSDLSQPESLGREVARKLVDQGVEKVLFGTNVRTSSD